MTSTILNSIAILLLIVSVVAFHISLHLRIKSLEKRMEELAP